jgi:hypothetical protein
VKVLIPLLGIGCGSPRLPVGADGHPAALYLPMRTTNKLDLLFVADRSVSMEEERRALGEWAFRGILDPLTAAGAALDLHVAVTSSDAMVIPSVNDCEAATGGAFHGGSPETCQPTTAAFLADAADGSGGRQSNFTGTLSDAFGCLVQLPGNGCGFEAPLEAMRRALDGSIARNDGFLRADALLGVVFLSDEDDCSAGDPALFAPDESELGPLNSFRCFEQGSHCAEDDLRSPGVKRDCRARADSPYLIPPRAYVDFLRQLKPEPDMVFAAGILGDSDRVEVAHTATGTPQLQWSCATAAGHATPALRLDDFLAAFPDRSEHASVCDDTAAAMHRISARIRDVMQRRPCLHGSLADIDALQEGVQPACHVTWLRDNRRSAVPPCADDRTTQFCHELATDRDTCPDTETGLTVALRGLLPEVGQLAVECQRGR